MQPVWLMYEDQFANCSDGISRLPVFQQKLLENGMDKAFTGSPHKLKQKQFDHCTQPAAKCPTGSSFADLQPYLVPVNKHIWTARNPLPMPDFAHRSTAACDIVEMESKISAEVAL
jgi:hypothetical protein